MTDDAPQLTAPLRSESPRPATQRDGEIVQRYPPFKPSPEVVSAISFFEGRPIGFEIALDYIAASIDFPEFTEAQFYSVQRALEAKQVYLVRATRSAHVVSAETWQKYQSSRSASGKRIRTKAAKRLTSIPRQLLSAEAAAARDFEVLLVEAVNTQERAAKKKYRMLAAGDDTAPVKAIEHVFGDKK